MVRIKLLFGVLMLGGIGSSACSRSHFSHQQSQQEEAMHMASENTLDHLSDGSEAVFLISSQSVVVDTKSKPEGFYIKGTIHAGKFHPTSEVLGIGELATKGRYGWLELNSRIFFPMESDQKANTPFIKGYLTDDGFVPSLREVIDTP